LKKVCAVAAEANTLVETTAPPAQLIICTAGNSAMVNRLIRPLKASGSVSMSPLKMR